MAARPSSIAPAAGGEMLQRYSESGILCQHRQQETEVKSRCWTDESSTTPPDRPLPGGTIPSTDCKRRARHTCGQWQPHQLSEVHVCFKKINLYFSRHISSVAVAARGRREKERDEYFDRTPSIHQKQGARHLLVNFQHLHRFRLLNEHSICVCITRFSSLLW